MTIELKLLVWSAILSVVLAVIAVTGAMLQVGLPKLAGNRDNMPEISGWAGRAARAHRNLLENIVLFAILVVAALHAGVSNDMTRLGAQLFFYGRLSHAVLYVAGVPWLRTVAWAASIVGLLLILLQLKWM